VPPRSTGRSARGRGETLSGGSIHTYLRSPPVHGAAEDSLFFTQSRLNTIAHTSKQHNLAPGLELHTITTPVYIGAVAPDLRGPRSIARSSALGANPRALHRAHAATPPMVATTRHRKKQTANRNKHTVSVTALLWHFPPRDSLASGFLHMPLRNDMQTYADSESVAKVLSH
jgi:hypothetical protein